MGIGFVGGLGIDKFLTVAATVVASMTLLPASCSASLATGSSAPSGGALIAAGFVAVGSWERD